jgi:hypothetical protein
MLTTLQVSRVGSAPHTIICAADSDAVCALCGAHLKHTIVMVSSEGKVVSVGRDCAETLISPENIREAVEGRTQGYYAGLRSDRESRIARAVERSAQFEAAWRAAQAEQAKHVDFLATIEGYHASRAAIAISRVRDHGDLEQNEADAARYGSETVGKLAHTVWALYTEAHTAGYIGTVGKRAVFTGIYLGSVGFESQFGYTFIHKFLVGNSLMTWKTTSKSEVKVGQSLTFKATVKAHTVYNGVQQSTVSRLTAV